MSITPEPTLEGGLTASSVVDVAERPAASAIAVDLAPDEQARVAMLARAQARADRIQATLDHAAESRLRATARGARTSRLRVVWLQRAADVVGKAVEQAGGVACRKGCAHCCHIPVLLTTAEADEIARVTGRPRVSNPQHGLRMAGVFKASDSGQLLQAAHTQAQARHTGRPCSFLQGDQTCGIYDVRPLTCRMHFSLSDDEGPCRLSGTEGGQTGAEVVSLNVMARRVDDAVTLGAGQVVADIREWFAVERH